MLHKSSAIMRYRVIIKSLSSQTWTPKFLEKILTPITSFMANVPKMENGNAP